MKDKANYCMCIYRKQRKNKYIKGLWPSDVQVEYWGFRVGGFPDRLPANIDIKETSYP